MDLPALGGSAFGWPNIQRSLAVQTTVYLGPGRLGWSDLAPGRRRARGMAEEFHALLGAPVSPPCVLVGHSAGGYRREGRAKVLEPLSAGPVGVSCTCIPSAGRLVLMD